jgi:hypothetical protein
VIFFDLAFGNAGSHVRHVGRIGRHGRWPRLNHQNSEIFPLSGIESSLAVEREIAEGSMSNSDRTPAIEGNEDLCVPDAPAAELGVHFVGILPNDSVERGNGETRERAVVANDVVARPDTHPSILSPRGLARLRMAGTVINVET